MKKSNEIHQIVYSKKESNEWYFWVWKELGGGFEVQKTGGPYTTKQEALLECGWAVNYLETYES